MQELSTARIGTASSDQNEICPIEPDRSPPIRLSASSLGTDAESDVAGSAHVPKLPLDDAVWTHADTRLPIARDPKLPWMSSGLCGGSFEGLRVSEVGGDGAVDLADEVSFEAAHDHLL